MKTHSLSLCRAALLAAFSLALAATGHGQDAKPGESKTLIDEKPALEEDTVKLDSIPAAPESALPSGGPEAPPPIVIPGLEKLTPEQRQAVVKGISDVTTYMRGVRLQESLEKLNEVEAITGDFHIVSNMRGAVFTKMRDFKSARAEFEKGIELTKTNPKENFHPRFNLAEINFVEKKWPTAREQFTGLLKGGNVPDIGTRRLMEYKVMICLLQEKKMEEALEILSKFDQYDFDSPAYYFGKAATSFSKENKEDAEEWLTSAGKIYPKELNDVYQDSLVEVGWLQTLQ